MTLEIRTLKLLIGNMDKIKLSGYIQDKYFNKGFKSAVDRFDKVLRNTKMDEDLRSNLINTIHRL